MGGFPGGPVVKNPLAKQETQVRSLGREDPLEKGVATDSSINRQNAETNPSIQHMNGCTAESWSPSILCNFNTEM